MLVLPVLLILSLVATGTCGVIELNKSKNETFTIDGDELYIRIDLVVDDRDEVTPCFWRSRTGSTAPCPLGFKPIIGKIGEHFTWRWTRFLDSGGAMSQTMKTIKSTRNGTQKIMVPDLLGEKTTITLLNAEVYDPDAPCKGEAVKATSNVATIGIIVGVVVLVPVIVIIGNLAFRRQRKLKQAMKRQEESSPIRIRRQNLSTPKRQH